MVALFYPILENEIDDLLSSCFPILTSLHFSSSSFCLLFFFPYRSKNSFPIISSYSMISKPLWSTAVPLTSGQSPIKGDSQSHASEFTPNSRENSISSPFRWASRFLNRTAHRSRSNIDPPLIHLHSRIWTSTPGIHRFIASYNGRLSILFSQRRHVSPGRADDGGGAFCLFCRSIHSLISIRFTASERVVPSGPGGGGANFAQLKASHFEPYLGILFCY